MTQKSWFVLPPDQAYYYKQYHADYKPLPEWRDDCQQVQTSLVDSPISLVYPRRNTQIYIPRELAGKRGKTLFKAIHRNPQAQLYWHLDNTFLGTTQTYHEQAIWINEGKHQLTLVDEEGNRVTQGFQVLSR